ncbi:MAG: SRPBCC family protein [Salinivirgaceae bacterium]
MEIESRIGKVEANQERIYALLSDFTNLGSFVPPEQVSDFKSDADSCSFTVAKIGKFGMRVIEREPFKLVKIANDENVPFQFFMWIQIKEVAANDSRVKITLRADLNPMLKMVAKKPLSSFVESLVSKIETIR